MRYDIVQLARDSGPLGRGGTRRLLVKLGLGAVSPGLGGPQARAWSG
jgi:hypothetical protein